MRDITLKLLLSDQLTGKLKAAVNSAKTGLQGLQDKMNGLKAPSIPGAGNSGAGSSIGMGQLVGANLIATALSTVASGVLGAGQSLVNSIGSAFSEAATARASGTSSASAISALLGTNLEQGIQVQDQVTDKLAEAAKRLPGSTSDYLQSFNGLSDTLSLTGGLTKQGITGAGQDIVELTALLAKQSGNSAGQVSTVIGKLLGDTGSEALFRIDAFEKVPAFKAILEKGLAKTGKTMDDFFKMDGKQKQEYLVKTKNTLFSRDYLNKMNQTADGLLDTLMSNIFDPTAGMFGFLRKVKVGQINTSVFDEIGKLFTKIGSVFNRVTEIAGKLGITFIDPMVALASVLAGVGSFVDSIAGSLEAVGRSTNTGDRLMSLGTDILSSIGSSIQSSISRLGEWLGSQNWGELGQNIGYSLGTGLSGAMDFITSFLRDNWQNLGAIVFNGARLLMELIGGVFIGLGNSLPGLIVSALTLAFQTLAQGIVTAVNLAGGVIIGTVNNMVASIKNLFDRIVQAISWAGNLGNANTNRGASGKGSGVGNAANGNLMSAINSEMKQKPSGSDLMIANSSELIVPRDRIKDLNNQVHITINAQLDRIVSEVSNALTTSLRQNPVSMT